MLFGRERYGRTERHRDGHTVHGYGITALCVSRGNNKLYHFIANMHATMA